MLLTPVTDGDMATASYVENAEGYVLTAPLMQWFWDYYADAADRRDPKASPLRALRIEYDELRGPPELLPGLSLGRFEERGNAVNALEKFSLRGIRSAKVIEVRTPSANAWLRVDKAPAALASQVIALNAAALGKGFVPCAKTSN